jgi:hypothetical protein
LDVDDDDDDEASTCGTGLRTSTSEGETIQPPLQTALL